MNFTVEKVKKMMKYAFLCITVLFAVLTVPKVRVSFPNALLVGLIASTTFAMFDMVSPSICIKRD